MTKRTVSTADPDRDFLIGRLLLTAYEEMQDRIMRGLQVAGFDELRVAHMTVFVHLPVEGGRLTDLAEAAGMTKQSMGTLVAYLEEHGYVKREVELNDKRSRIVERTDRGWQVNALVMEFIQLVEREWEAVIGPTRWKSLKGALRDLAVHLGYQYKGSISDAARQYAKAHPAEMDRGLAQAAVQGR